MLMSLKAANRFSGFITSDKYEQLKLIFLSMAFFLVIGSYTIVRDLRDSIFMGIVGKEYIPYAKFLEMIVLIPAVLFYSFLVDRLRRYQLLYFYTIFYGISGLICAYLLGDSVIGLANTDTSPYRMFGWFFYFLVEGFAPFVVNLFWAFANSINTPEDAKNNYALMVSGSKVGGMLSAALAWGLLSWHCSSGQRFFSDVANHQLLLGFFSVQILIAPIIIYLMMKKVPGRYLHGYEAVYQYEKHKDGQESEKVGIFAGFAMLLRWPYLLGIFGMVFFYEIINTILSYQRLGVAQASSTNISDVTCFLFQQSFALHFVGFLISLFGTRALLKRLGEEWCLILVPIITALLLLYFMLFYTPLALLIAYALFKSVNYAFAQPVRESLYIPTVKEMKFKSKSWIDAFGAKLARGTGSGFNLISEWAGPALFFTVHSGIFGIIIVFWLITAVLLGKRYTWAVQHNEVIGAGPIK